MSDYDEDDDRGIDEILIVDDTPEVIDPIIDRIGPSDQFEFRLTHDELASLLDGKALIVTVNAHEYTILVGESKLE